MQRDVRQNVLAQVGRRFVPPGERPSTGVGVEMGRRVSATEIASEIGPYIDFGSDAHSTPIVLSDRFGFPG